MILTFIYSIHASHTRINQLNYIKFILLAVQIYACNLSEKAKELKREKRKSDMLLFQMLPPSVATQLKQTQKVPAEYYEEVTVYFSDIVGFTEIAAECTPLEVRVHAHIRNQLITVLFYSHTELIYLLNYLIS